MDGLRRDIGYAVRRLLKAPGFTLVALLSLALGVGANTAIFSIVDAVILRGSPLSRPDELVELYMQQPGFSHGSLSYPDYVDLREQMSDVFQDIAASRLALLTGDGDDGAVEMLPAEMVSGNYFALQGIEASVGRTILPSDDVEGGAEQVVMLGHGFWERRYGGDPGIVGQEIRVGGQALTVVGVVEQAYQGTLRGLVPDVYVPVHLESRVDPGTNDLTQRGNQSYFARGRLVAGATPEQATVAAQRATDWLHATYPDDWVAGEAIITVPRDEIVVNPMIDRILVPALGLLLGVVGIVLLIACANLASFLLARSADRRREVAVRLALGARRGVLIRQLLTETVLLGLAGGAAGVALAAWLIHAFQGVDLPLPLPVDLGLSLNAPVLLYALGVSLLAGLLFGLTPAVQASNPALAPTLKNEATGQPPRRFSLRNVLVVGQVSLSLLLLVGAGLLLRSMQARQNVDPGFGSEPAAVVQMATGAGVPDDEVPARVRELLRRARELAGVRVAGVGSNLHLNTLSTSSRYVDVPGVAPPPEREHWQLDWASVSPGFMEAAGLHLLRGRTFTAADGPDADPVVIVNQAFADQFFDGEDPVGRSITLGSREQTVVGLVNTARIRSLGEPPRPFVYSAFEQSPSSFFFLVAQTDGVDPRRTALEVSRLAREVDSDARIYDQTTMERHLAVVLFPARASALAASVFAGLALLLAAIGLYGVVSYAVSRKTREVGIRMSLGAESGQVVRMLMAHGLRLVVVGGVLGMLLSALGARVLARFLYGVTALDPLTFFGTGGVLLAVAVLAAWVPARRVARVDPVRALKVE